MKTKHKAVAALAAATLLGGCASGGSNKIPPEFAIACGPLIFLCLPTPPSKPRPGLTTLEGSGPDVTMPYEKSADGSINKTLNPNFRDRATASASYIDGRLASFRKGDTEFDETSRFTYRDGGIVATQDSNRSGLFANPHTLGWTYQSFGAWNSQISTAGSLSATSFGTATPGLSMPRSGTATFAGKLAGFHVTPAGEAVMATGDLTVNVNFGAQSLNLHSTGTTTSQFHGTASPAPHLDLSGTLKYSPANNAFSGALRNSDGTMTGTSKGQFYGPKAQELGGVFSIKSPTTVETFTGGYGAKR